MALFAISDLHLSFSVDKPMDVFGWGNHAERIEANWRRVVKDTDTVVIAGDISWGMKLYDALEDLKFIDSLPGNKILIKGNHDLWWQTRRKMEKFFADENIKTIRIIYNDAVIAENYCICGTRGWSIDEPADNLVIKREAGRLRTSLEFMDTELEKIVFLHFPPVFGGETCEEIWNVIKEYGVKRVYYGHIHGIGSLKTVSEYDGVKLKLTACDHTDFTPVEIV